MNLSCSKKDCPSAFDEDGLCLKCGVPQSGIGLNELASASSQAITAAMVGAVKAQPTTTAIGGYTTGRATGARRPNVSAVMGSQSIVGSGIGSGSIGTGSGGNTSRRGSSRWSTHGKGLTGGLVSLPTFTQLDPLKKVMENPRIPPKKILLCEAMIEVEKKDGRLEKERCNTRLNPEAKACANCATKYNFQPKLKANTRIAGEIEVKGPVAFGGLGWIYQGFDTNLNRFVAIKGILNSNNADQVSVARAERQFLASINHGKIMKIYRFINHEHEEYMVMEWVNGRTAMELRKERGPLPADEACAYLRGILPALQYLHEHGISNPDFSPDNFMIESDGKDVDVKLIDAGAFRQMDDTTSAVYIKPGYVAPETANYPGALSDIFIIGRTLAYLVMDFDNINKYRFTLPSPNELQFVVPDALLQSSGINISSPTNISASATLANGNALPEWLSMRRFAHQIEVITTIQKHEINFLVYAEDVFGNKASVPAVLKPKEWRVKIPLDELAAKGLNTREDIKYHVTMADGSALQDIFKLTAGSFVFVGNSPEGIVQIDVIINTSDSMGNNAKIPLTINLPLAAHESLYRFLLKATHEKPEQRFQSIPELTEQLDGVIRDIVSLKGVVRKVESAEFLPERSSLDPRALSEGWKGLPELKIQIEDSAAQDFTGKLSEKDTLLLVKKYRDSAEARFRFTRLLLEKVINASDSNQPVSDKLVEEVIQEVMPYLDQAAAIDRFDWRPDWYCGLVYLALQRGAEALECFDRVYSEIPGEIIPRLALALSLEYCERYREASSLYEAVLRNDPTMVMPRFGLGRVQLIMKNKEASALAYSQVPDNSSAFPYSKLATIDALMNDENAGLELADIRKAGDILLTLTRNDIEQYEAEASFAIQAATLLEEKKLGLSSNDNICGIRATPKALRKFAEAALIKCSKLSKDKKHRIFYIDWANSVRPSSFL